MIVDEQGNVSIDAYSGFSEEFLESSYMLWQQSEHQEIKEQAELAILNEQIKRF